MDRAVAFSVLNIQFFKKFCNFNCEIVGKKLSAAAGRPRETEQPFIIFGFPFHFWLQGNGVYFSTGKGLVAGAWEGGPGKAPRVWITKGNLVLDAQPLVHPGEIPGGFFPE